MNKRYQYAMMICAILSSTYGFVSGLHAQTLSMQEVQSVLMAAAASIDNQNVTVAVSDRPGNILGIFGKPQADGSDDDLAVSLARTAAFFSNNQAPLSSRTVRFISGLHFPPQVSFTPNAALYGIENTNRGCDFNVTYNPGKEYPQAKSLAGTVQNLPCDSSEQSGCGLGITTGKQDVFDSDQAAVNPGGIPIYRGPEVVGGVGVVVRNSGGELLGSFAEFAGITGALAEGLSFVPDLSIPLRDLNVVLDGIQLDFVKQFSISNKMPIRPAGSSADTTPPPGATTFGPFDGNPAPDGYLVGPMAGSELTEAEVDSIVQRAIKIANKTRAAIRLPRSSGTRMVIAVADLDGTILAVFRMPDATIFSIDVSVAKARNVVYFSGPDPNVADNLPGVPSGTAITNRTISFGAQPFYPPGIDGSNPGPFFDLLVADSNSPCSQGSQVTNANQNGVVFFPGSTPLYRKLPKALRKQLGKKRQLVGGLGVSGDGVEQDDFVSKKGGKKFKPRGKIRADRIKIRGVRLPFLKFLRNPRR